MPEEYAKVLLVNGLSKDTIARLDNYITATYPADSGVKETMEDRLARVSYTAIIGFLK